MKSFTKALLVTDDSVICNQIRDRFLDIYEQAINNTSRSDQTKVSNLWGFPICRLLHPKYTDQRNPTDEVLIVYLCTDSSDLSKFSLQNKKSVKDVFYYTQNELFLNNENYDLYLLNTLPNNASHYLLKYGQPDLSSSQDSSFLAFGISVNLSRSAFCLFSSSRFIADVLLALTSPSFIQAAADKKCESHFDWKMHLLERRVSELPSLDETLNYSHDELDNMRCGRAYDPTVPTLEQARSRSQRLANLFNQTPSSGDALHQKRALQSLLASPQDCLIVPPFQCDYGFNIFFEKSCANFRCTFLDCGLIIVGEGTMFGPNVDIYTVSHPLKAEERKTLVEFTAAVTIGKNSWICGKSTILPGVRIGDNVVVGAGSVVTKDVPDGWLVAGNPARLIRYVER